MPNKTDETSQVSIEIWGNALWNAIHSLSFSHPVACEDTCNKKQGMHDFLKSLKQVIPCEECRGHYSAWFDENVKEGKNSAIFKSRDSLTTALVNLHNEVNTRTNKPQVSIDTVRAKYITASTKCPGNATTSSLGLSGENSNRNIIILISSVVVASVIAAGVVGYRKYKKS
uniref:thiol oxidase n=1 Tax=viral metagenome TaxID=1070528 RepID=A0A6C0LVG6_9ZZZZ